MPESYLFAERVRAEAVLDGLQLFTLKTKVKDVVTITGSLLGGAVFSPPRNIKTSDLVSAMLDKGTGRQDKFKISKKLENVGAVLNFSNDKYHIHFTGYCLKNDVPLLLQLLAEQIRDPAFSGNELETLKIRLVGNLERSLENTQKQAAISFLRQLYPPGHANFIPSTVETISLVKTLTTADLKSFHNKNYGLGNMLVAAVGDINHEQFKQELDQHFNDWQKSPLKIPDPGLKAYKREEKQKSIEIPGKTSVDMYLGQSIGIHRDHKDFHALMMAVYILGGNFSARLMQTVRDRQGLTYGIGSGLAGVDFGNDGYWNVQATFAPDLVETGKQATLEQLLSWFKQGIYEEELEAKKDTISGAFKINLDTTDGLAGQILMNAERRREIEYLDRFPGLIQNLRLEEINSAIKKYIDPEKLITVIAGSINKN